MKSKTTIILSTLFLLVTLSACTCDHEWKEATCTTPKTCTLCGDTEGEVLPHEWKEATYTTPQTCSVCGETEGDMLTYDNMPEGLILNEAEWEAWESTSKCYLGPLGNAMDQINCSFTLPTGKQDPCHKECKFIVDDKTLKEVVFYYYVEDQRIWYVGLVASNPNIYEGADFKEACIRLMLSYNIRWDNNLKASVLNLTRERAEEIVSFCFENEIVHCLVDNMRIRLIRDPEDNFYSFHIEY